MVGCGASGSVGDVVDDPAAVDEVKGKAACSVEPNPVLLNGGYTINGRGLPRAAEVRVSTTDGAGAREAFATSSADGTISLGDTATALGSGAIELAVQGKRGWRTLASCGFTVITPPVCGDGACAAGEDCGSCSADCGACGPVCGDGACEAGETCSSCAADCGACGPVCGDGACEAGETCSSCAADCGACGPVCGNGTCEAGEDCGSCAADCGACPSCEPAVPSYGNGRHNAGKDCMNCHGSSAITWSIAGTLYNNAAGSAAVAGATIVVVDARGREYKLVTQANGNFYTTDTSIAMPVRVKASRCPSETPMVSTVSDGSCNSCHSSGFRIHLP